MRGIWEYDSAPDTNFWEDAKVAVTVSETHVRISVTEEQAVDSYNQEFTCSVDIPIGKAAGLLSLLQSALASKPTS